MLFDTFKINNLKYKTIYCWIVSCFKINPLNKKVFDN